MSKTERPAASPPRWPDPASWKLPVSEPVLLWGVFGAALLVRLIYLWQYSAAPEFYFPFGDSENYLRQARAILAGGGLLGQGVPFQSPGYPVFMAAILGATGQSLFLLRCVQTVVGSANCVLIYLLARKLSRGNPLLGPLAGLAAAGYGVLVFFDGDLLAVSLVVFLVDLTLWLLLRAGESGQARWAWLAGASFGLAAFGRTNLLLFVPFGAWYAAGRFSPAWKTWAWRPALGFAAGVCLMILPVTLHNRLAARDLVLVSSNAGINLFIGNNPAADGIFRIPPGTGLANGDLAEAQVRAAERAAGRSLKPSEVSDYWADRAWRFVRMHPGAALKLYAHKLRLLFNYQEIPNHLSFDYIANYYAPILKVLFVGYGWILPLALVGILWRSRRGLADPEKLLLAFAGIYVVSLLPFFITDRYRLPLVPVLIVFAAIGIAALYDLLRARAWAEFGVAAALLLAGLVAVNTPVTRLPFSHSRLAMADKYLERAESGPRVNFRDVERAVMEYKTAIEESPYYANAYLRLAGLYRNIGYFSGTIALVEKGLSLDPEADRSGILAKLAAVREKYRRTGDVTPAARIPLTPYEKALEYEGARNDAVAGSLYAYILERDPYHTAAALRLAEINRRRGDYDQARQVLRRALKYNPGEVGLLAALANISQRVGDAAGARRLRRKIMELEKTGARGTPSPGPGR